MARGGFSTVVAVLMDALVIGAILLTAALVAGFFGVLAQSSVGTWLLSVGRLLTVPLSLPSWQTPYGGIFVTDTGATVAILLAAEWFLSILRRR